MWTAPLEARSGKPTMAVEPHRLAGQLVQRGGGVPQEVLAQQQILGRVAGERQLGKQHELGLCLARGPQTLGDAPRVAGDVADSGVQLAEGQAHRQRGQVFAAVRVRARAGRLRSPAARASESIAPSSSRPICSSSGIAS